MKVELVSIESIIPYEKNAKEHPEEQISKLAESIKLFGFTQPVVIDETNTIVIGHGRTLAAKSIGIQKIPVIKIKDKTRDEIKALRIFDNKIAETSWNLSLLKEELISLQETPQMSLSGFDDFEVSTIASQLQRFEKLKELDTREIKETNPIIGIKVLFDDEELLDELFQELNSRGFKVKSL
jgi:hypothetical protein